jgi:hypothetical protein
MNKYHNKKVVVDGLIFDSKKEGERWKELKLLESSGEIEQLERQVKFDLLPKQTGSDGKVIERKVQYVADFIYIRDGEVIVEDVKGYRGGGAYEVFKLKKKMMLYFFGIQIKEI